MHTVGTAPIPYFTNHKSCPRIFSECLSQLLASASARTITIKAGEDFEATCLHVVEPGDTCYLEKGDYKHDGLTVTHGTADKRITITGHSEACIRGSNTQDRVLQIAHDYYTVDGICFNGQHSDEFAATAIYVLGEDKKSTKNGLKSSVTGLQLFNLEIKNFNSECIHFRYFVTHAEVQGCTIINCGKEDFEAGGGGKVGEGIYLGTALDQVNDNKVSVSASNDFGAHRQLLVLFSNEYLHARHTPYISVFGHEFGVSRAMLTISINTKYVYTYKPEVISWLYCVPL